MNRLRLIQEELLDGKKQVARTQFRRKVFEDAMVVFGCDENGQSKNGKKMTFDGQENGGQENGGESESIKTGSIPSLTIETQDLIRLYNKLVKDKK